MSHFWWFWSFLDKYYDFCDFCDFWWNTSAWITLDTLLILFTILNIFVIFVILTILNEKFRYNGHFGRFNNFYIFNIFCEFGDFSNFKWNILAWGHFGWFDDMILSHFYNFHEFYDISVNMLAWGTLKKNKSVLFFPTLRVPPAVTKLTVYRRLGMRSTIFHASNLQIGYSVSSIPCGIFRPRWWAPKRVTLWHKILFFVEFLLMAVIFIESLMYSIYNYISFKWLVKHISFQSEASLTFPNKWGL